MPIKSSPSEIRRRLALHEGGWAWLNLAVDPADTPADLSKVLAAVRVEGSQRLSLSRSVPPFTVPLVFAPAALLRGTQFESAELGVRYDDEPACGLSAGALGTSLRVSEVGRPPTIWERATRTPQFAADPSSLPCVDLGVASDLNPSALVGDANTAFANGHWPVVRVPRSPAPENFVHD